MFVSMWKWQGGIRMSFQFISFRLIVSFHKRKPRQKKTTQYTRLYSTRSNIFAILNVCEFTEQTLNLHRSWSIKYETNLPCNSSRSQLPYNHTDCRLCVHGLSTMRSNDVTGSWQENAATKLTKKTAKQSCSGILIVNFKHSSHLFLVLLLLILDRSTFAGLDEYVTSSLYTRSIPLRTEQMLMF